MPRKYHNPLAGQSIVESGPSSDRGDGGQDLGALALSLRNDPDLTEVAAVWKLLSEPVRLAIMQLVRAKR